MKRFKQTTSEINKHVRGMSDEELLKCISDDRVMVPFSLMSIEDMGDMIEDMEDIYEKNKRKGLSRSVIASFDAKKKAIEKELNRRGLKWRSVQLKRSYECTEIRLLGCDFGAFEPHRRNGAHGSHEN